MYLIIASALLAAWSGGSLWPSQHIPKYLTWVPEALFSMGFAYALYPLIEWYALLITPWPYIWMQSGHGNALSWGVNANPAKPRTLEKVVNPLCRALGIEVYSRAYSAVYFAIKGFLISLPIGGVLAPLWAASYDIGAWLEHKGMKNERAHMVSELLSGASAGLCIIVFIRLTEAL